MIEMFVAKQIFIMNPKDLHIVITIDRVDLNLQLCSTVHTPVKARTCRSA